MARRHRRAAGRVAHLDPNRPDLGLLQRHGLQREAVDAEDLVVRRPVGPRRAAVRRLGERAAGVRVVGVHRPVRRRVGRRDDEVVGRARRHRERREGVTVERVVDDLRLGARRPGEPVAVPRRLDADGDGLPGARAAGHREADGHRIDPRRRRREALGHHRLPAGPPVELHRLLRRDDRRLQRIVVVHRLDRAERRVPDAVAVEVPADLERRRGGLGVARPGGVEVERDRRLGVVLHADAGREPRGRRRRRGGDGEVDLAHGGRAAMVADLDARRPLAGVGKGAARRGGGGPAALERAVAVEVEAILERGRTVLLVARAGRVEAEGRRADAAEPRFDGEDGERRVVGERTAGDDEVPPRDALRRLPEVVGRPRLEHVAAVLERRQRADERLGSGIERAVGRGRVLPRTAVQAPFDPRDAVDRDVSRAQERLDGGLAGEDAGRRAPGDDDRAPRRGVEGDDRERVFGVVDAVAVAVLQPHLPARPRVDVVVRVEHQRGKRLPRAGEVAVAELVLAVGVHDLHVAAEQLGVGERPVAVLVARAPNVRRLVEVDLAPRRTLEPGAGPEREGGVVGTRRGAVVHDHVADRPVGLEGVAQRVHPEDERLAAVRAVVAEARENVLQDGEVEVLVVGRLVAARDRPRDAASGALGAVDERDAPRRRRSGQQVVRREQLGQRVGDLGVGPVVRVHAVRRSVRLGTHDPDGDVAGEEVRGVVVPRDRRERRGGTRRRSAERRRRGRHVEESFGRRRRERRRRRFGPFDERERRADLRRNRGALPGRGDQLRRQRLRLARVGRGADPRAVPGPSRRAPRAQRVERRGRHVADHDVRRQRVHDLPAVELDDPARLAPVEPAPLDHDRRGRRRPRLRDGGRAEQRRRQDRKSPHRDSRRPRTQPGCGRRRIAYRPASDNFAETI